MVLIIRQILFISNFKKMKNYIKLILFIIVIIFTFSSLEAISRLEAKTYRWNQFKQIEKNSLDIIYLGNSHNMQGVIPQISKDVLNLNGFALGVPGESIQTTYFELIELYKTQSPKYIGIETFALDTNLLGDDGFVFSFTDSISFSINSIKTTLQSFTLSNAYNHFSWVRQHVSLWKSPEKLFELYHHYHKQTDENLSELTFYLDSDGYYYNDLQITQDKIDFVKESEKSNELLEMDIETQYYLEKIIDLCEQHESHLFLFTMPVVADYFGYEYKTLEYNSISQKYNLPYIDLRNNDFSLIHFSDTNHLTQLGALRATINISQELSNFFGLSINQNNLENYQQMNIDQYSIERLTSQSTRFALLSNKGDLEKNEYSFVVNYGDEIKGGHLDSESQAATILEYEIPDTFRMTISITNPNNNYLIKHNLYLYLSEE